MIKYFTPLRYPGGKAKLAWFVKEIFRLNELCDGHYAEPYAGGAGVAIELLLTGHASEIHLNDLNYPVYAFWHSVLHEPEALCRKISNVTLSINNWKRQRNILENATSHTHLEVGLAFLFLNRTNRSGIINAGVIGGYDQTGPWKMDARFNREGLIERISRIADHAEYIHLYNMDALDFLSAASKTLPTKSLIYLDPPYFKQGKRLYDNFYNPDDHAIIAKRVDKLKHRWLVSYDDAPEIRHLYRKHRQTTHNLQYNAGAVYRGTEVLIFSEMLKLPPHVEIHELKQAG